MMRILHLGTSDTLDAAIEKTDRHYYNISNVQTKIMTARLGENLI